MKKCYEYFSCNKKDCSIFKNSDSKCWEDEASLCGKHGVEDFNLLQETVNNKTEACKFCVYFNLVNKPSNQHYKHYSY